STRLVIRRKKAPSGAFFLRAFVARIRPVSVENPVTLQIDDLPCLVGGEIHRVVVGGVAIDAHEAMLLAHAADLLFDRAGGLKLALALVGGGADDVAVVFDRVGGLRCTLGAATLSE